MPGFDSIIDQERIVRRLSTICRKGNIPHALLFTGHEGVGKIEGAKLFAMACNCLQGGVPSFKEPITPTAPSCIPGSESPPCGGCRPCRKIRADIHPDVVLLVPQKGTVRISQIRDLFHTLAMKPYEARQRVVIIRDAHTMSPEAGNSLLKVLEEPPERTSLILTAPHSENILPTIVSRCQHFRFKPVSRRALTLLLTEEYGLPLNDAEALSLLANGSIAKTRSLVESGWMKRRKWVLDMLSADQTQDAVRGLGSVDLRLAFSEKLSNNKDDILDALEIVKSWYRDLMIYPLAPENIMNKDKLAEIRNTSQQTDVRSLLSQYEAVQTAQELIEANANPRLTIDVMMMRLL